ncbi:TadE/TadG family type IV pilus assembly protein [Bosea sp. 2KB_26]|uniref:TadE/TadG family type IV pilus assembly protein n=1 Tax=unclassified Bosea (in: a-proteobacteria) TaxID=2653178 RepID=UPI000853B924|nr:TadE/TadG family type IV pilus assembly protein [Bosea sp. BIWAKO-01]GAU81883.1 TadZ/CpaE protein [Bosea sp. BIWAKO-01]
MGSNGFCRNQRGATAVEFGLVAFPFLLLVFTIIETGLMLWTYQVLDDAVKQASRTLLTGESVAIYSTPSNPLPHDAKTSTEAFRREVCAQAPALVDCEKLRVDVRGYVSPAAAQTDLAKLNPFSGNTLNTSNFSYNQPGKGEIVVVRATLRYSLYLTGWTNTLANIDGGERGLMAVATFRSEPP